MKKIKSLIITVLAVCLLFGSCSVFLNNFVYAADSNSNENWYGKPANKFEISPKELLDVYAEDQKYPNKKVTHRHDINDGKIIPVYFYEGNKKDEKNHWSDGKILANDSANFLSLSQESNNDLDKEYTEKDALNDKVTIVNSHFNSFMQSLIDGIGYISKDDIYIEVNVSMPKITQNGKTYEAYSFKINSKERITNEVYAAMKKVNETNKEIATSTKESKNPPAQQVVSVTATIKNQAEYKLVIGTDDNFYFLETKPLIRKFDTELTYSAEVDGKDVGYINDRGTCVPNYDKSKPKKDADVTAIIKSTTDLDILTVDGVPVGTDKNNPNKDGWYYIDSNNKKVIAKLYKFQDYNNLNDNGTVVYDKNDVENNHRGKVKVILGSIKDTDGKTLTSEENVSIQWPFRIIEEVQNPEKITKDTKKVTVTVTTNLPIDKEKLPDGWNFTDTDLGKTQHQVYKEFNRDDGDVIETPIFTENGRNDKVQTQVNIKWPKDNDKAPNLGPQAGAFSAGIIVIIIGGAMVAITRYRKLRN